MNEIAMATCYAPPYWGNLVEYFKMPKKDISERRAYERFDIVIPSDMSLPPHCPGFGRILDISRGGLSFVDENNGRSESGFTYIDILFGNNICCLKNIPCRLIHDGGKISSSNAKKNIGRIQFGELSQKQKMQLEYLIKMNTQPKCHSA